MLDGNGMPKRDEGDVGDRLALSREDEQQLSDTLEVEPILTTGDIKLKVRGQLCACGNDM